MRLLIVAGLIFVTFSVPFVIYFPLYQSVNFHMGIVTVGRITEENRRSLEISYAYEAAELSGMDPQGFSEELSALIAAKGIPVQKIVDITGLSKSYINKLRNLKGQAVQPARPVILNIGLALALSVDEINRLLKSSRYQELYARNTVDSVILWGLMHGHSGNQIRSKLSEMGIGKDILHRD